MSLKINQFGQAQKSAIEDLEKNFDIVLPEDYKQFLLQTNGGGNEAYKYENAIEIGQINDVINIDIMFGIDTGVKNADIAQWTSEYRDDILENSIIIGSTMQQGFLILWQSNDENEGIYYYDDTYELESSDDEGNTYFLASSFSDFLKLVTN